MSLIKQYCVAIHAGVEVDIVKLYKSVGPRRPPLSKRSQAFGNLTQTVPSVRPAQNMGSLG